MPNKTTFLSASAILLSVLVSSLMLVGCKNEESEPAQIEQMPAHNTNVLPKPLFPEKTEAEEKPEQPPEESEKKTLSDDDATKIAEQLSIMWGSQEDEDNSGSNQTNGEPSDTPNWREMTEEELIALQKAQQDAKKNEDASEEKDETEKKEDAVIEQKENEDENINTNEEETEEEFPNNNEEEFPNNNEEEEKEESPEKEDSQEKPEEAEKNVDEMSREKLILEIVSTINKYTSEKSQQRYLKETLDMLKGYNDEIGLLLDIKSFLPENLHSDINTRITEIIAQEREEKES